MIRIVALDIPDRLGGIADRLLERLREELEAAEELPEHPGLDTLGPPTVELPPNKAKVDALKLRAERHGRAVCTKHVVSVVGIDESDFYKWQRGRHVSKKVQMRCEEVMHLSAAAFLQRLDMPTL